MLGRHVDKTIDCQRIGSYDVGHLRASLLIATKGIHQQVPINFMPLRWNKRLSFAFVHRGAGDRRRDAGCRDHTYVPSPDWQRHAVAGLDIMISG
jgi:hypothetical protein